MGFEPTTFTLATWRSTTELHPLIIQRYLQCEGGELNPHAVRHKILNLARLPVPPPSPNTAIYEQPGRNLKYLFIFLARNEYEDAIST